MADFKYTLLENGLDFVLSAIENLSGKPENRQLKYAILHLHSGIELILKECLRREHWSLVFEKVEDANKEKYESGDFISVQWKTCLTRLKGICEIEISNENLRTLEELRKKRNRLEHFNIIDTTEALISSTIPVLNFLVNFVNDKLGQDTFQDKDRNLFSDISRGLGNFNDFVTKRMLEIRTFLDAPEGAIVTCPRCFQETLDVFGKAHCYFCGYHQDEVEKTITEYINHVKEIDWHDVAKGEIWPVFVCPECGAEALVQTNEEKEVDTPRYTCFKCGQSWDEIDFCIECGNPIFKGEDNLGFCDDCYEYKMHKDD